MITIDNKFEIGETVYLVTDKEQIPRMVTAFIVDKGTTLYEVINTTTTSRHYDFELSNEINVLLQTQ